MGATTIVPCTELAVCVPFEGPRAGRWRYVGSGASTAFEGDATWCGSAESSLAIRDT